MMSLFTRSVLLLLSVLLSFTAPLFAQSLQPSKTGLPGRTVWALTTSATGSGAARQMFTFAATDKGLWKSADNGGVWTEVPALKNQDVFAVKARQVGTTTTLLAATKKGIMRSQDGGASWASPEVTTGTVGSTSNILELKKVFDIEIVNSTWYAATEKGVFRSTNDGRSWTLLNIDRSVDNNEVRGITAEGSTIIVNLWKEGLWRSTNNGSSWAKLSITGETALCRLVYAHPGTSGTVWLAGSVAGNLWRSVNGGTSWTRVTTGSTTARSSAQTGITLAGIDAMTSLGRTLFAGTATRVVVSYNDGQTWRPYPIQTTKPLSMASNGRNILFIGFENEQNNSLAAKESPSQTHNSDPGVVSYNNPFITKINYSQNPIRVGQTIDVEILGEDLLLPPSLFTMVDKFEIFNFSNPNTLFWTEQFIISHGNPFQAPIQARVISQAFNRVVIRYPIPDIILSVISSYPNPYARISFYHLTVPEPVSPIDPAFLGPGYPPLGNSITDYFVPVAKTEPTLTGPTTALLRTGIAQNITLTGTNFIQGTTKVYYSLNGGTRTELTPVTVSSPTSLGVSLPATALTATGSIAFTAEGTAGSPSAALNVLVHNPLPTIQTVSPTTYARNSNNPITITGTGFVPETRVRLDNSTGWLMPTYVSPTQVRVAAFSQYNTGGTNAAATSFQLLIDNPLSANNQGGGVSANVTIPIVNPAPGLSTINPLQIFTGQQATIALSASYLMPNTVAQFNNKTYTIAPAGFSQTAIIIPPADLITTGSYPITLFTPTPGGGTSQQVYVSVVHPQPFVSSIAPTTVNAGRDTTVTLTGYSFISGASVYIENVAIPLVTTFLSGTSLRAVVPANRIPTNGTYRFYVVNPTPNGPLGGTSGFVDLTVNTPVANLTGITPTILTASAAAQTLALSGTLFEANAVAWISGTGITTRALTTTVQHGALATATIPADIAGRAGTYTITLKNPNAPDSQTQTLTVQNPAPTLQTLNPASTLAGSNGITLTLKGTNFVQGAVVVFNGTPLTPGAVFADSITVSVPSSALAVASSVQVLVRNPAPSAGDSPALPFAINNPFPRLDSATAHPLMGGMLLVSTQATTVTLYGGNFILASQVKENGGNRTESTLSSQRLTQGTMTATIPVEMTAQAGTVRLLVENPTPGGGRSQALTLPVINPAPRADHLTPNVIVQSSNDLTLIITGDRFVAGAEVLMNNLPVTVSQNTPTRLTVSISANRIAERGQYVVVVRNPQTTTVNGTPDGGVSTPLTFTVNTPQALVTGITLNGSASGQVPLDTVDVPLVVTGSHFLDSAIVRITAPNNVSVSVATTSITTNEIRALLPASVLNRGGVYTVTVQNPAPTEAVSTSFTFAVVNPAPVVDSIAPRSVQPSLNTQNSTLNTPTITVFGKLFTPTSVVRWRGQDLPTQFVSRTRLTATLPATPATLQTLGGVGAVTVFTPTDGVTFMGNEVGGGTGSAQGALGTLLVSHAVPSLTSLVQSTVTRDAWATQTLPTLSMTGELFASNATVRLVTADSTVNTSIPFSSQTPTNLSAQLPRSLMAKTGVVRVRVQNAPAFTGMFASWLTVPDGGTSEERFFTMVNPTPTLGSLTPAAVAVATPGNLALSLSGTNFIPESVLLVNGRVWTRSVVSAMSMTASLPDSLFTLSGYVRVQVVNPAPVQSGSAADSSNVLQLEIFNPVPTLTAVAPVFTTIAGRTTSDSVTVTLTGTNFVRNSVARLALTTAGSPTKEVPTTFRSRDTLLVRLLAADWTAAAYNMTVLNPTPRGGTSVARRFTVTAPVPVLTALLPSSTTATGKAWTLTLTGQFFTATSQVSYRNTLQSLTNTAYLPGTSGNADTLRVKLVAVPVGDTTFPVAVYNPPTGGLGGGTSSTLLLAVGLPVPQISSLAPASTAATLGVKERRGVLVVNGSFFDDAAKVFIQGQAVATEFVSTTRLRAYLPDSLLANQARRTVQVRNTPVLISNIVNFTVQNPTPVLNALTPSTITAGRDTVLVLTGDKFAPDATVALIYGSTVTPLSVIRRDSVLSLQVRVPDTLITRRGAYTIRVTNRPLALDTTTVGGGSDTYALSVIAAPIARVEVSGTDTLMNAGDRSQFITLSFRDHVGNLVDADPVSVSFVAAPDTSLPLALRPTPATGTFPVVRWSIGTYRLDTLRFYQSGAYTLRIDTSVTGTIPVFGPTHFVVRPLADASADITGLRGTSLPLPAGDTIPSVTVVLKDKFGNFTDNSTALWSFVRTTGVPAGGHTFTSTATVQGVRLGTGYYRLEATQVVGAGLYTYSLAGAGTGFLYNGERTALVTPLTAVNTDFANLRDSITAGAKQSKVQVIFTDRYRNRTDALLPEQRALFFSNSGDTTMLPSEAFTQSEALTQRTVASGMYVGTPVIGVYDASNVVVVPFAGRYRLSVQRITTTTGTASFVVVPAGDYFVTMTGVKDTITAGEELPAFMVSYRDRFQNPTDNAVGQVKYSHSSGSSTATLPGTHLSEGEYRVQTTVATLLAGTYTVSVANINSANITGNRTFVVKAAPLAVVEFTKVTSSVRTLDGSTVTVQATYTDRYNNLVDFDGGSVTYSNTEFSSSGTIQLVRVSKGKYSGSEFVKKPGKYTMDYQCSGLLDCYDYIVRQLYDISLFPGNAIRADFANVPTTLVAGKEFSEQRQSTITLRDWRGNKTHLWRGAVLFTGATEGTIIVTGNTLTLTSATVQTLNEYGVLTIQPTWFAKRGNYSMFLGPEPGSTTNTVVTTTGNRTIAVTSTIATAVNIQVQNTSATVAGNALSLKLRYTDRFNNPTNFDDGVLAAAPVSGIILTTTQTLGNVNGFPVYTSGMRINTAGTFSLGVTSPEGTTFATVSGTSSVIIVPAQAQTAVFMNTSSQVLRGSIFSFSLLYRDRFDNPTSNNVTEASVRARIGTGAWLYTVPMVTTANVGFASTTTPSFTALTAGTYTLQALNDAGGVIGSTTITVGNPTPTISVLPLSLGTLPNGLLTTATVNICWENVTTSSIRVRLGNHPDFSFSTGATIPTVQDGDLFIPVHAATGCATLWTDVFSRQTAAVSTALQIASVTNSTSILASTTLTVSYIGGATVFRITTSTIDFASVGITKSSLASYSVEYENIPSKSFNIVLPSPTVPPSDFAVSTTATGPFIKTGSLNVQTPSFSGTQTVWVQFTATTTAQRSIVISHQRLNIAGSPVQTVDVQATARGKTHLVVLEWSSERDGCAPKRSLSNYVFSNVKKPARSGDVRGQGKIIGLEYSRVSEPIKIEASEGYVITVAGDLTQEYSGAIVAKTYDCATFTENIIQKPEKTIFTTYLNYHSITQASVVFISTSQANYQVIFSDGDFVRRNYFDIWLTSVAPNSCDKAGTLTITSGNSSTTLTVSTMCSDTPPTLCVTDDKRLMPNDKYLLHYFSHTPGMSTPLPVVEGRLLDKPGLWYICNPVTPSATIKIAEAWKLFDFQGSPNTMISIMEAAPVWDKHPDFLDANGNSKVSYIRRNQTFTSMPSDNDWGHTFKLGRRDYWHATLIASNAVAIGNNSVGIPGVNWQTKLLSSQDGDDNGPNLAPYSSRIKQSQNIDFRSHSESKKIADNAFYHLIDMYKQDMVGIGSAGNDAKEVTYNLPWSFVVGVSNLNDDWGGSDFGEGLDLVAPGNDFFSGSYQPLGASITDPSLAVFNDADIYTWSYISSSNAAPMVSATAALLFGYAREKMNNKYLSNDDVMNILRLSADKVYQGQTRMVDIGNGNIRSVTYDYSVGGSVRTAYLRDGWNERMGHGRLNVCKALSYLRDGSLEHYTTAYNEKLDKMPGEIIGLNSEPIMIGLFPDAAAMNVDKGASNFNPANYGIGSYSVRRVEVRKTIKFSELSPQLSFTSPPKVWGNGSKMASNGAAPIQEQLSQPSKRTSLNSAGWCQPITATNSLTTTEVTLQTFVYQILRVRNASNDTFIDFTDVWFPCKPENVVFKYSIFKAPSGLSVCDEPSMGGLAKHEANVHAASPNGLIDKDSYISQKVELLQNKPNPFSEETTIEYSIPEEADIQIDITDALGRKVAESIIVHKQAGKYSLPFSSRNLSSGIYVVRLSVAKSNGQFETRTIRMSLIK